ncbi:MAG: TPR end-of-group domain-containing protein, partial [Terracidiphilus sp.]
MSNAASSTLRTAEPLSPVQATLARQHLEQILASRTFASSKRTQAFLSLIVSRALEGDIESLHERMIGAELFGRPISYDTGNDSVVRVRASELRKKLAQYYSSEARDRNLPVRFELHSGSYVPSFLFVADSVPPFGSSPFPVAANQTPAAAEVASPKPASPHTGRRWLRFARIALPAAIAVALLALGVAHFHRPRNAPAGSQAIRSIAVLPFDNLSGAASQDFFADGLTEELI